MTLLAYSLVALPLWAAQFALYFFLRSAGRERESLIAKCAGSFLAVGSAGLALHLAGENPFSQVVFWFFLLCTIADALLEISFVPGMLVFGAAHVCLILWLWDLAAPAWWSLGLWVGVYVLTAVLFRKELPTLGKLTVPFLLYPALLGGQPGPGPAPALSGGEGPVARGPGVSAVLRLRHAGGEEPALPLAGQMAEAHYGPVLGGAVPDQHRTVARIRPQQRGTKSFWSSFFQKACRARDRVSRP